LTYTVEREIKRDITYIGRKIQKKRKRKIEIKNEKKKTQRDRRVKIGEEIKDWAKENSSKKDRKENDDTEVQTETDENNR
jgi:hypothetical protein